jgi:hypothetical protein
VFAGVAPVALVELLTSAFAASAPAVLPAVPLVPLPVLLLIEPPLLLALPVPPLSMVPVLLQPARANPAASNMVVVTCFMVVLPW